MIVIGSETTLPPGTRSGREDRVSPGIAVSVPIESILKVR